MLLVAAPVAAQQRDLRASQMKLDSIRQEQARLQRELSSQQTRVRDASRELTNISRQREASASALLEMDFQASLLDEQAERIAQELATTQSRMRQRRHQLGVRLRSIYKRGPLHSARVMLGAESFSNLLNRYKYLHLLTERDRTMIAEVAELERSLVAQDAALDQTYAQVEQLRQDKEAQVTELERLERQRQQALRQYRQAQTRTEGRLEQLARDERQMTSLIETLERERLEAERRAATGGRAAPAASISTRDLGSLDWPVEGRLLYRFGPERRPNGVVLRNQGIGIAAAAGTTVRAVEAGTVVLARPFEGYGPTVMLSHGGGYYTLYLYLGSIGVREGQDIGAGASVGTVGGEQTPEGAHLEFQVRAPVRGGVPEAVDPLSWLRGRSGG
jgi:septal ring factor EnvC (AmiA/AmiB activator)